MPSLSLEIRKHVLWSLTAVAALIGGAAGGAVLTPISGAITAPGIVVVEHNLRRVQHQTGGTISSLLVSEGQRVGRNDVLVRLDDTMIRASQAILMNDLRAVTARRARLLAERDGSDVLHTPAHWSRPSERDEDLGLMLEGERRLLQARRASRDGQKAQLRERIEQLLEERRGAAMQLAALGEQRKLALSEVADLEVLLSRNMIQKPRVTQLQREVMRLDGAIGELTSKQAQLKGRVSEIEQQILQIDADLLTEITTQLREAETKISELSERRFVIEDQLARIEVRAPIAGQVHQLAVHTVGGVISPGETMMLIVPDDEQRIVEARISPADVDEVRLSQQARVRLTSIHNAAAPELIGEVVRVAGDLTKDPQTGAAYYSIAVQISASEIQRLGASKLKPGMPAELFLHTSDRTIASFIVKPFFDHMNRAFRES